MRFFAERWTSARRGVAKVMACVITTGLIALFAPGCDSTPTPKPGEPGGGPKVEDAVKPKGKEIVEKDGNETIAEKRAKKKAAAEGK